MSLTKGTLYFVTLYTIINIISKELDYVFKKTPNAQGRIRLSIVDNYYDKQKK